MDYSEEGEWRQVQGKRDTTTSRWCKQSYAGRNAISKLQQSHFMREEMQLHINSISLPIKSNKITKRVLGTIKAGMILFS